MAEKQNSIMAIVSCNRERVHGGGAPVFIADNQEMLEKVSQTLSKVLDASAHKIDSELMIIVKH